MPLTQHNVCLIDDDNIYQFTARKILESTGMAKQIQSFYNGKEAISYLKAEGKLHPEALPDVIFLDINMPVMNGWEFLEEYNNVSSNLPKQIVVYMVSSSIDDNDIRKSKEYKSVSDYIVKPVDRRKFQELIGNL